LLLSAWSLTACGNGGVGSVPPGGSNRVDGGPTNSNGGSDVATGSDASPVETGAGDAYAPSDGPNELSAIANVDGGGAQTDAGVPGDGGGLQTDGGTDSGSGARDMGSCCTAQSTPGCSNATLEVCVCEKDPSCCTMAWSAPCILIVQQKYCQPGVRDCVCGSDAGQWGQTDCCNVDWSSPCDSVATLKCNAVQGCF
jgi:hypothetical protein